MKVFASMSLIVLLVASSSQNPPPATPGRDPKKLQVLILNVYNMHDWLVVTEELRAALEATGRFEVRANEEPVGCTGRTFDGYDAVVLNFTNHAGSSAPPGPTRRDAPCTRCSTAARASSPSTRRSARTPTGLNTGS